MSQINMPNNPADGKLLLPKTALTTFMILQPTVGWFRRTLPPVLTSGRVTLATQRSSPSMRETV